MDFARTIIDKIQNTSNLYIFTFLFFITFICYANTLGNGLFYDDEDFIYKNVFVQEFSISDFFTKAVTEGTGKTSNYYRPLLLITYGLEYKLFGNNGFIYHLDSMLIHFGAGIFLFLLLEKLFNKRYVSLLTTILFLVHPVQTEAVSYVSGRGDPLALFFLVLTLYLSLSKNKKYLILSFFTLILALISKEIAIITAPLIVLTQITYHKKLTRKKITNALFFSLPYVAITVFYGLLRLTSLNLQNTLNFYNSENIYTTSLFVRINTFLTLLSDYFGLLFIPTTLFIDRNVSIYTIPTAWSIFFLGLFLVLCFLAFKYFRQIPILFFSVFWFVIAFIPTSGITPINGIFYEHFLYFPSIGFFLLFSYVIFLLSTKTPGFIRQLTMILLIAYLSFFCIRTIIRNGDWHDPITFYASTLQYTETARIRNNLAMAYAENGENNKAIDHYKRAIELYDVYPETHYNLGNTYLSLDKIIDAEKEYKKAIEIDPFFPHSYFKLYEIYKNTGNIKEQEILIDSLESGAKKQIFFKNILDAIKQNQ